MISIIIPMYNAEGTIVRCLDSIINQSFSTELEILIVNDGSADNSKGIVENYINNKPKHKIYLLDKENGGASSARNVGLDLAKGNHILFLDSDDTFVQNSIEYVTESINANNSDIACFGYEFFDDKNKSLLKFNYNKVVIIDDYINDFLTNGTVKNVIWNKIYCRKFLVENNIKFHSNFEPNEDSLFVFEILLKTRNIIFLEKILYNHISDNKESYTNKFHNFHYENALSLLKHYKKIIINELNDTYLKSYDFFCMRVLCRLILVSTFSTPVKLDFYTNLDTIYVSDVWKRLLKSKQSLKSKLIINFFNTPSLVWYVVQIMKKFKHKIQ
jgi:glycosyltransferase involved in cell wall biosynthesis